jgi:hypothetical protein
MENWREERDRPKEEELPEREKKERERKQEEKWIRKIEPPSDRPGTDDAPADTDDGGNELSI